MKARFSEWEITSPSRVAINHIERVRSGRKESILTFVEAGNDLLGAKLKLECLVSRSRLYIRNDTGGISFNIPNYSQMKEWGGGGLGSGH